MMSRYAFTIEGFSPQSLNRFTKGKVRRGIRARTGDRDLVCYYAKLSGIPPATGKRRVSLHITLPRGVRAIDPDNAYKAIFDGLKQAGAIRNDSYLWVEIGEYRIIRGTCRQTVIILDDLDSEGYRHE